MQVFGARRHASGGERWAKILWIDAVATAERTGPAALEAFDFVTIWQQPSDLPRRSPCDEALAGRLLARRRLLPAPARDPVVDPAVARRRRGRCAARLPVLGHIGDCDAQRDERMAVAGDAVRLARGGRRGRARPMGCAAGA